MPPLVSQLDMAAEPLILGTIPALSSSREGRQILTILSMNVFRSKHTNGSSDKAFVKMHKKLGRLCVHALHV